MKENKPYPIIEEEDGSSITAQEPAAEAASWPCLVSSQATEDISEEITDNFFVFHVPLWRENISKYQAGGCVPYAVNSETMRSYFNKAYDQKKSLEFQEKMKKILSWLSIS